MAASRPATSPSAPSPGTATILDVAALAGVSRTTVSRVLNHPDLVPADTIARVEGAIDELGFRPSSRARGLRTGRFDTIALLVGDASQPFQSAVAKAVARAAEARGLNVLLCDLDHSEERLITFLRQLPRQGVDGIVISTGDDVSRSRAGAVIAETRAGGTPIVISGRLPEDDLFGVGVDFTSIADAATTRLIENGSRRPILLIGDADTYVGARWAAGYRAAVERAGLDAVVLQTQYSDATSTQLVLGELSASTPADGIIAGTVPLALSAVRAAHHCGRLVPDDLAIIACEQVGLAELVTPAVSTIGVTAEASGEALVEHLSQLIAGRNPPHATLPYVLSERQTTRHPAEGETR